MFWYWITSNSCPICTELKNLLQKDFSKYGIDIDFGTPSEEVYHFNLAIGACLSDPKGINLLPEDLRNSKERFVKKFLLLGAIGDGSGYGSGTGLFGSMLNDFIRSEDQKNGWSVSILLLA